MTDGKGAPPRQNARPTQQADGTPISSQHSVSESVPAATLPAEFWSARPYLKHIQLAAHSMVRSADAVLGCVLARLASMCSPDLRLDFGLREGSLNLYVALYGPSGVGKSESSATADDLLPVPRYLQSPGMYRAGGDVGTGEGMCEAYMGYVNQEEPYEVAAVAGRKPRITRTKVQVRKNVFFYSDEAVGLITKMNRKDSTLGPTLRSAFSGQTLGSANASIETSRYLPRLSYSMGIVVGFQLQPAVDLMADAGTGTPQRFIWLATREPNTPNPVKVPLEWPGPLDVSVANEDGTAATGTIGCPPELRDHLRYEQWQRTQPDAPVLAEIDSHLSYTQCKVACLLAILDGRHEVDWEDWRLAGVVLDVSNTTRDRIIASAASHAEAKAEQRMENQVQTAVRTQVATLAIPGDIEHHARRVAFKVHDTGTMPRREVSAKLSSKKTFHFMKPAIQYAIDRGWVREEGPALAPGDSVPSV